MVQPPSAGVIGWPVAHSKSPLIHRFWLAKLGLDGDYGRFPVHPDALRDAIRALPALGLRGVNVTVPHKVAVMAHLDEVDATAAAIGAVNTVVVRDGRSIGYNTDAQGFIEPLGIPARAAKYTTGAAIIIGAGGAARAIAFALHDAGYRVDVVNRDVERARQLAEDVAGAGAGVIALADFESPSWQVTDSRDPRYPDILVNATSLGMTGAPPLPVDLRNVSPNVVVYDIVYSPLETPLLAQARARGMRTIDGLAMLIGQAAVAFKLLFDAPAPREHDAELRGVLTR